MCLIVDANLAAKVFAPGDGATAADFAPVLRWLESQGCLVYGGLLAEELGRVAEVRRYLIALSRAGRARLLAPEAVAREEAKVRDLGGLKSNDLHVVALARASGARTLCSHDQLLHQDFKNASLISDPRGAVYQQARHKQLLKHTSSCGR